MLEPLVATLITAGTQLLTGVQARWLGCAPSAVQRIYFANHASHTDFVLVWSVLPARLKKVTRPVAAADYWDRSPWGRYLMHRVFHGVPVIRGGAGKEHNPIATMCQAFDEGASLILFSEGTRGPGESVQPFKSGIFHLAESRPHVELVPAWIDNSYRVMPKGVLLPIPLLCSVAFGKPAHLEPGERKEAFLARLRQSLVELGAA